MIKLNWLIGLGAAGVLAGCAGSNEPDKYDVESYEPISNPASVYCAQKEGKLLAFNENNERIMYCVFSEDEKYEQWEFYNNRDKKDEN